MIVITKYFSHSLQQMTLEKNRVAFDFAKYNLKESFINPQHLTHSNVTWPKNVARMNNRRELI